jgi:hypothetical protein
MKAATGRRRSPFGSIAIILMILQVLLDVQDAKAELGPCTTAAPTTPNVVVLVSDLVRSVNWYNSNLGLIEGPRSDAAERLSAQTATMRRDGIGVTLITSSGSMTGYRDPQVICFVLEGPPAPPHGAPPIFLADPDGVSVELAPQSVPVR